MSLTLRAQSLDRGPCGFTDQGFAGCPLEEFASVDSSCRWSFGFAPAGSEPGAGPVPPASPAPPPVVMPTPIPTMIIIP